LKILDGLKVIDLTTIVSGPYAASLLADLGADVIKVEQPGGGDPARVFEGTNPRHTLKGLTPHLLTLARNKRSIVINLRDTAGRDTFYDFVRWADVVVDNYRPGVTERLAIDFNSLRAVNPRIIACSITGYGLTGPGKDRAALDACIQAYAGVMGMTGEPDGAPMRAGPLYSDLGSGMAGALGILAAVVARDRTGIGQQVDISMLDVQISMLSYFATMHLISDQPVARQGNEHALHVPYNAYAASDGFLFVAVVVDPHWAALADALRRSALPDTTATDVAYLSSERLLDRLNRLDERDPVNTALARIIATRSRETWLADLSAAGVPVAPVHSVEDAVSDPQVLARQMVVDVPHPAGGSYRTLGNPVKLSEADVATYTPPPRPGEHTAQVLREVLGYDGDAIDALVASGAVEVSHAND
jgi:crotonobetainyl-CoA:carnitine CoA-transferase CaiB-like acyl-CoA transferase